MTTPLDVVGSRGSATRRRAKREAVISAHVELAMRAIELGVESGWLGPEHSPLGPERHVAAVRARLARGERHTAAIVAGRALLTIDAIVDEVFGDEGSSTRLERALAWLGRRGPSNDNGGWRR